MASPRSRGASPARHPVRQFFLVSTLAGVLLAGLMLPVAGGIALSSRNAAQAFESLPNVLDTPPLPQRSVILAADGSTIAEFYAQNRIAVPLSGIGKQMQNAIVAIEDSRFYEHGGVDIRGTLRALRSNTSSGSITEGGSTITQQYVKTMLVESATTEEEREAARERSVARKLREARMAVALEQRLSKQEILERYLNTVYFGEGAYGVQSAALRYFSTDAIKLNVIQSATLAAVVQSPVALSPRKFPKKAQERRNLVLDRMAAQGFIPANKLAGFKKTPIEDTLKLQAVPNGCARSYAPYFCDFVIRTIQNDPAFGKTAEGREAFLQRGGLTIKTGLDPDLQRAAQDAVDSNIPRNDPSKKATAVSVVEPGTGVIKAMAQNRTFGTEKGRDDITAINFNVDTKYGGSLGAQPGSTFKVFVLAAALQQGISYNTSIYSPRSRTFYGFTDCEGKSANSVGGYEVQNSTGSGRYTMASATANSVNTFFVALEQETGLCDPQKVATKLGVTRSTGEELDAIPSFVLGSQPVSPLAMAEAYATFAARGVHCNSLAMTSMTRSNGRAVPIPAADCRQVIKPAIADGVNQLLTNVMTKGTGRTLQIGREVAGKTGTTNENAAVWFVGHTPQLATAVWIGDPRGGQENPIRDIRINGRYITRGYGGLLAGPIWQSVMEAGHRNLEEQKFQLPDPAVVAGLPTRVPDVRGLQPAEALAALTQAGLKAEIAEYRVTSQQPENSVAYTSPGAERRTTSGREVRVYLSDGIPQPVAPVVPVVPNQPGVTTPSPGLP